MNRDAAHTAPAHFARPTDGIKHRLLVGVTGTKFLLAAAVILISTAALFSGHMTGSEFGVNANAALLFFAGSNWLTTRDTVKKEDK